MREIGEQTLDISPRNQHTAKQIERTFGLNCPFESSLKTLLYSIFAARVVPKRVGQCENGNRRDRPKNWIEHDQLLRPAECEVGYPEEIGGPTTDSMNHSTRQDERTWMTPGGDRIYRFGNRFAGTGGAAKIHPTQSESPTRTYLPDAQSRSRTVSP